MVFGFSRQPYFLVLGFSKEPYSFFFQVNNMIYFKDKPTTFLRQPYGFSFLDNPTACILKTITRFYFWRHPRSYFKYNPKVLFLKTPQIFDFWKQHKVFLIFAVAMLLSFALIKRSFINVGLNGLVKLAAIWMGVS